MRAKTERIRFTPARVRAFACPPGKTRHTFHDTTTKGLALVASAAGRKSYILYSWLNGRPVKRKIGPADGMTLDAARKAVLEMTAAALGGIMPSKRAAERLTLADALQANLDAARARGRKSWAEDERRFALHLGPWARRPLASITRPEVVALHQRIGTTAKHEANRVVQLLVQLYHVAQDHLDYSGPCPAERVRRFPEHSRERYLTPDELRRYLAAADEYRKPALADLWGLLLWTGVRRRQADRAAWADIDLEAGTWLLLTTKTGRPCTVYLNSPALAILRRRRAAVPAECPWAWPGRGPGGHVRDSVHVWNDICAAAGIPRGENVPNGVRPHDLRRTLAVYAAEAGASAEVVDAMLGHQTPVYARVRPDTVRAATEKAANLILRHAGRLGEGLAARLGG